ncbi:STAS-like domain-containing protein [Streptococcus mutans]|nr:STAS-like domain-containing protein [Streptococcus mutans]
MLTLVEDTLRAGEEVMVSFEGVSDVSTSFVNSAFINLLENFTFKTIKAKLSFIKSTIQINKLIKERFTFESLPSCLRNFPISLLQKLWAAPICSEFFIIKVSFSSFLLFLR